MGVTKARDGGFLKADKRWYLRRHNLVEGLAPDEVERMAGAFRMTSHAARTHLEAGAGGVLLLKQGKIRLYRLTRDGREATTAVVILGQLFGTGALLAGERSATRAEVIEDALVCTVEPAQLLRLMASSPALMARVMMSMARQIAALERRVEEMGVQALPARLARLLLEISAPDGNSLECDWSQDELASALITSRESVTRTLGDWRRRRIVEPARRRIVIRQVDRLRAISDQGVDRVEEPV